MQFPFKDIKSFQIGDVYCVKTEADRYEDKFKILEHKKISNTQDLYLLQIVKFEIGGILNPYSLGFWNPRSERTTSLVGRRITLFLYRGGYLLDTESLFRKGQMSDATKLDFMRNNKKQALLNEYSKKK